MGKGRGSSDSSDSSGSDGGGGNDDFAGLMPADVKAATAKVKLLKFVTGLLAGSTVALLLILVFVVLTGENPPVVTANPVFDPSPGVYEAGGNAADDWQVSGSSAVSVIAKSNDGQVLPEGVTKVTVYATSAAVPGQHRSSELIDIFDDDKPCGNPCEQTKLQMTSRKQFYTSSCMRAIAVGDGMVSSGISSGTYLVRAKPINGFVHRPGYYSGLPNGPVDIDAYEDTGSVPTDSWARVPLSADINLAETNVDSWDPVPSDGEFITAPFIGFSTPYDVAPRHFEVIFTFTSREDVQAGYVCKARKNLFSPFTLPPEPLQPESISGHPRWRPDLPVEQGGVSGTTGDCEGGETGLCQCPESQRVPTPVQPMFNEPYTMRWCLTAQHCKGGTNTYTGTSKAEADLLLNDQMTTYWPNAPYIAEFDGTLRAIVVADNYQNSIPIDLEIRVQTVAPVRIFPSGEQALTMESYNAYARKSSWITMTDDIYLWTPTPNTAIFYAEGVLISHDGPSGAALDCPAGACPADRWTCFSGCASSNTGNFTRSYSADIFVKATKIGYTDSPMTQEYFEVKVAKPIVWPKFETSDEWFNARKGSPANATVAPLYTTDTSGQLEENPEKTESLRVSQLSAAAAQSYVCDDLFISGTDSGSTLVPTCDLDASTDDTADCPNGCTETLASTPTCDLDPSTDGTASCPGGCDAGISDDTATPTCSGVATELPATCTGDATPIPITESSTDCMDRYYLNSVQIFIATQTPTELAGVSISDCPDEHKDTDSCPRQDRAVVLAAASECPADAVDCTCDTNSVGVMICGIRYCPPGASCPLREKIIKYELGESGLGESASFIDYSDATAPRLWESNRIRIKAEKIGLTESDILQAWFRVKLAMPTIVDDPDQIDVAYQEERRNYGSTIALETYVTVNADSGSTRQPYAVGPVEYTDGDTDICMGQTRQECTTGSARHAIMYYSLTGVEDLTCDCRHGKGYINGYGPRPINRTASCNWRVYDDASRPTLLSSSNFCTQIVAIDGVSVNSDVAYRRYWIKSPTVSFDETNHPIYTSQVSVKLSTVGGSENAEPATRSIWYVLANPGSDWWTTSEDADGCLLGGSCTFSTDRVRQAPKACPHWACGAACPQIQNQCPPQEFQTDGSRALVTMSPASTNGGLNPTDSRTVYNEGPISYYDLIAPGVYDPATGALDTNLQTDRAVQLYDPVEGIALTENKVIFAFSTQESWAVSNIAARDFDIRTADPVWSFSTSGTGTVPEHIDQSTNEGITKYVVKATTSTPDSRVHVCRKKRCPMSIQRTIASVYSGLDSDDRCDDCGTCNLIASLKNDVLANSEFQGSANLPDGDSTNDYGQGEVYNDLLESGCMMYFFQAYPNAATKYASCELGAQDDAGGWVPYDVRAEGSYWFTTDVLGCQWKTMAGDTAVVAGQAADAYIPTTWEAGVGVADANSQMSAELHFNSAVMAYASKRNVRPSFFRGQVPRQAGFVPDAGPDSSVNRAADDDWATSYTEYLVKVAAVSMTAEAGTTADRIEDAANGDSVASCPLGDICVDYSQDVTLTSSTPGARIHYKFFPDYPRENTLVQIPVNGVSSWNVQCGGNPNYTPLVGATSVQNCFKLCVAESESGGEVVNGVRQGNPLVRFCQYATNTCSYLDTCESPTATAADGVVTAAIDWDTMRSSLPDANGRMDPLGGFSVTEAAPDTYGCLDDICQWGASPMVEDDTRRFAADPLTSQDLTLPDSGWRKIGEYDELDGSATVQGNAWSHCSQANVVSLEGTLTDPTPAGADPLQQTENSITVVNSMTDTTNSSCKLHITRSGRLFAFATRVSDDADDGGDSVPLQGVADNNVGGLQVPSDVTWADFQLKNPEVSYEVRADTCGTTGEETYCSPQPDSNGRVLSSLVERGWLYACAGSRVKKFPPLMASQSSSNGAVVCDQDRDTRIHYTSAQDTIAASPDSICESDMESVIYNAPLDSYTCPGQTGIPLGDRTKIWKGSVDNDRIENNGETLRARADTRFWHVKAKAVKQFAADSEVLSLTFKSATSLCRETELDCDLSARLAQTDPDSGVTDAIVTQRVTDIAADAGHYPSQIPGMQTDYLGNIKQSGSGWETRTLEWMYQNTYNEAECITYCEAGESVPTIPDFSLDNAARFQYNAFVVDMDLPKAASGVGMVPILQVHVTWPQTSRAEAPKGCAAFSITARQYTGRTFTAVGNVGTDYTALRVKGGQVKTCCADVGPEGGCTRACTQAEATTLSMNLFDQDDMNCVTNGCDLEAHTSHHVDPYRSGIDVFLMHGSPIVDGLRYTCQKQGGYRPSGDEYSVSDQKFQMGSWEVFGIKIPRTDYVVDLNCDNPGEMLDCYGACRSVWTLGDGFCDDGFNCAAMVYDELDCLTNCEETPNDGVTCSELVSKGVSKKIAEAGGWDCSCTSGP